MLNLPRLINNSMKILIQNFEWRGLHTQMKQNKRNLCWIPYLMVEEVLSTLIKFKLIELNSQSYQIKFLKKTKE